MGKINKETFQRLYVLFFISQFPKGVLGETRLHKTVYEALKKSEIKPFGFIYHNHGQFSVQLFSVVDQLVGMGYLIEKPFQNKDGHEGKAYRLNPHIDINDFHNTFGKIGNDNLLYNTNTAIDSVGYMKLNDLLDKMYKEINSIGAVQGETVFFEHNIPEKIDIAELSEDECENLELMFNPDFISAMGMLATVVSKTRFDKSQVKRTYGFD